MKSKKSTYEVKVEEFYIKVVEIEAASEEEAENLAADYYDVGNIVITDDDFVGTRISARIKK